MKPDADSTGCRNAGPRLRPQFMTTTNIEAILSAIEKRAKAVTPGEWKWHGFDPATLGETLIQSTDYEGHRADEAFIAAARTDVPALVKALRVAMGFIHAVDIGCYEIPEVVRSEIAAILSDSQPQPIEPTKQ